MTRKSYTKQAGSRTLYVGKTLIPPSPLAANSCCYFLTYSVSYILVFPSVGGTDT